MFSESSRFVTWYMIDEVNAEVAVQTINLCEVHVANFDTGTSRDHLCVVVYT